jgi:hypothetical protein
VLGDRPFSPTNIQANPGSVGENEVQANKQREFIEAGCVCESYQELGVEQSLGLNCTEALFCITPDVFNPVV